MTTASRYLGMPEPIEIDGHTYNILPLTVQELPLFFRMAKGFNKLPKDTPPQGFIEQFDEETFNIIAQLIEITAKRSYPDDVKAQGELMMLKNFPVLLQKILDMNSMPTKVTDTKKDLLNKIAPLPQ